MSRKRIVLVYLGTLVVLLAATWLVLRETGVARPLVQRALAGVLRADRFSFRDASIDAVSGTVRIDGLTVATAEPGFRAEIATLTVGLSTHPLRAPGRLRDVELTGARIEIDLRDGRRPDFPSLLAERTADADTGDGPPPITLVGCTLALLVDGDDAPLTLDIARLSAVPLADDPSRQVLEGEVRLAIGPPLTLRGTASRDAGIEVGISAADVPLSATDLGRVHPSLADRFAEFAVQGRVDTFTADVRIAPDGTPSWRAAAVLDRLAFSSRHVPHAVQDAKLELWSTDEAAGSLRFVLASESTYGDLRAVGTLRGLLDQPDIDVRIEADDVLVRPELGRALASIREARQAWDAFEPSGGRASAVAHFRRSAGERPRFDLDLTVAGVGARYVGFESSDGRREFGFPHPIRDVTGQVRVRRGVIHVEDVRATVGGRELRVAGTVDTRGRPPVIALDFRADALEFTAALREALGVLDAGSARVWDEFEPRGEARLAVALRTPGDGTADVRVRLEPLLASACYAGFPCRVEQIRGTVEIGRDAVVLDLAGTRDRAEVALRGRFALTRRGEEAGDRMRSTLWIRGSDVSTDAELRRALEALSPQTRAALDFLGAEARADFDLSMWREPGAEDFAYDVRIDVLDGSVEIERLGVPIRNVRGPVILHGDGRDARIDVVGVRGEVANSERVPNAEVVVQGEVRTDDAGALIDIAAVVTGLELRDEIGDAVDRYGAFDREVWDVIRPSGFVDLVWRQKGRSTATETAAEQQLELQLRGVGAAAAFLPAPARDIRGSVRVEDRRATFEGVTATMAGAPIALRTGHVEHADDRTVFHVEVTAERFPLDDRLGNVLPAGPLRDTWLARHVDGAVRVVPLRLTMEFPDADPAAFVTEIQGEFEAIDVAFDLGARVQSASGSWSIDAARVGPDGGTVRGRLERTGATVLGHTITKGGATFVADSTAIRFDGLRARVHGGVVAGGDRAASDVVYRFGDPGELEFDIAWDGLSLPAMAAAAGVHGAVSGGVISGAFRLERLVGDRIFDAVGQGSLRIEQADLGEVPIFQAIYSYLEKPQRPHFDALSATLDIRDRDIAVDDLTVESTLLRATGRGSIGMDGYVDMVVDFPDFFGSDADWLFLPQLVRSVSNQIVRFKVYGYLRNLRSQPVWLGIGAPRRGGLLPVPPATERDR